MVAVATVGSQRLGEPALVGILMQERNYLL